MVEQGRISVRTFSAHRHRASFSQTVPHLCWLSSGPPPPRFLRIILSPTAISSCIGCAPPLSRHAFRAAQIASYSCHGGMRWIVSMGGDLGWLAGWSARSAPIPPGRRTPQCVASAALRWTQYRRFCTCVAACTKERLNSSIRYLDPVTRRWKACAFDEQGMVSRISLPDV